MRQATDIVLGINVEVGSKDFERERAIEVVQAECVQCVGVQGVGEARLVARNNLRGAAGGGGGGEITTAEEEND